MSVRTDAPPHSPTAAASPYAGRRIAWLAVLAVLMLVPVTLPVTVLRGLVQERFAVSEFLTSLFMSINMIGAFLAAPLAGAAADRFGRRVPFIVSALALDALLFFALTLDVTFPVFLALRFAEGCTHIIALSLLLGLASNARDAEQRGRVMGLVGGGITLGVALGAPLGGVIGAENALVPLYVGGALVALAACVAAVVLREVQGDERRPGLGEILATIREHRLLLAPLAFAFADRFTVGFYTTTFSLFLSRIHGLSPPQIGLQMALFMLPFALLSYPFGRLSERVSRVGMIAIGSAIYGVATIAVGFCPAPVLPFLMLGLGVVSAVMFVPSLLITSDATPEAVRTTSMGAFNAAGSLGFIIGPLVGGWVSESVAASAGWAQGYRVAFGVAGVSELVCVAVSLPFLLRLVRMGKTT
ncbi:MAG: MFS transporter [Myxococcota bacterium]